MELGQADKTIHVTGPDGVRWTVRYVDSSHRYYAANEKKSYAVPGVTSTVGQHDAGGSKALPKWSANASCDAIKAMLEPYCGEVLDPHLLHDAVERARTASHDLMTSAGERGTRIHAWAEAWANHEMGLGPAPPEEVDEDIAPAIKNLRDWIKVNEPKPIMSEVVVFHPGYKPNDVYWYAGQLDLIVEFPTNPGVPVLVDLKSSAWPNLKFLGQLAAYREAVVFREDWPYDDKPHEARIIMVSSKRDPFNYQEIIYDREALDAGWEAFNHCLALQKYQGQFDPFKRNGR